MLFYLLGRCIFKGHICAGAGARWQAPKWIINMTPSMLARATIDEARCFCCTASSNNQGENLAPTIQQAMPCTLMRCCAPPPQDMTTLAYLNEPGVLDNLKARYTVDDIYTYTGSILIAVNPFQRLPHLYGTHMMEQYRGVNLGELSPHVYAIADAAYQQMRRWNKSQSILVGGATLHDAWLQFAAGPGAPH